MNLFARVANEFVTADRCPRTVESELDQIFHILANERRRETIEYLSEYKQRINLDLLSREIAERECGPDYTSQQRKRVYISLYQSHLRKLDKANVIETEKPFKIIEPGPNLGGYKDIIDFTRGCSR